MFNNHKVVTEGTVLYENTNGSNGNITLNDSVENYKYIEISAYKSDDNSLFPTQKFYNNYQNCVADFNATYNVNGGIYSGGVLYNLENI